MNIKRLQAFKAVIELGSITEAANHLCLTQPGVSRHISALEDDLGFQCNFDLNQSVEDYFLWTQNNIIK